MGMKMRKRMRIEIEIENWNEEHRLERMKMGMRNG